MTKQELAVIYSDAHPTSLSTLSEDDWHSLKNRFERGIDWVIRKMGRGWMIAPIASQFRGFPLFRTKRAAGETVEALILAESHWRDYQRLHTQAETDSIWVCS